MYRILDSTINASTLNFMLEKGSRVFTFVNATDSLSDQLQVMRDAELLFDKVRVADVALAGMPVLLFSNEDGKNTVIARTVNGIWVDVTEATEDEIKDIRFGVIATQPPPAYSLLRRLSYRIKAFFGQTHIL